MDEPMAIMLLHGRLAATKNSAIDIGTVIYFSDERALSENRRGDHQNHWKSIRRETVRNGSLANGGHIEGITNILKPRAHMRAEPFYLDLSQIALRVIYVTSFVKHQSILPHEGGQKLEVFD
jgi:hypothetical protein